MLNLLQHQRKHCMGPATGVVHLGAGDSSATVAQLHPPQNLTDPTDGNLGEILDVGAVGGGLANLEVVGRIAARGEQIANMLVVDLEVRDPNSEVNIGRIVLVNALEQVSASARDEPRILRSAHHGVTLSRASLAVGKDAGVISLKVVVQKVFSQILVNIFLVGVVGVTSVDTAEGSVISESFLLVKLAATSLARKFPRRVEVSFFGPRVHLNKVDGALVILYQFMYQCQFRFRTDKICFNQYLYAEKLELEHTL
jgi:hypothetical protein